ncbi:MAG: hypothetical protein P4M09_06380, partial [Devosia sp.]|nr:hypothetical protein [Devosia sp.]
YTLTLSGFLLLGARAGDILGRHRMFEIGLVLSSVSFLLIGPAPSRTWMISARALPGLGQPFWHGPHPDGGDGPNRC